MMKQKENNDVTNLPHVVYDENETELSWSIGLSVVYHQNQTK